MCWPLAELYVQLREAERAEAVELIRFDAEPACWRWWLGLGGERLVMKPDAFVTVAGGAYEQVSFVEVDRATESGTVLRRKALTYVAHYRSGQEQRRLGIYPQVLWLVPDERRQQHLIDVLADLDPDCWRLFEVRQAVDATAALIPGGQEPSSTPKQPDALVKGDE